MASVPDRTGPNLDVLADSTLNESPVFPFYVCPNNGYIELDPAVEYDPTPVGAEIVLKNIPNFARGVNYPVDECCLAVAGTATGLMITNKRLMLWETDWETGVTSQDFDPEPVYNEQQTYVMRIEVPDKDNITVTIFAANGDTITSATMTSTDMFSGNPTFCVGFPTDAQLGNTGIAGTTPIVAANNLQIVEVRAVNPGPTAVVLSPKTGLESMDPNYFIGYLSATHARSSACPCTYALVAGDGDTDNASYKIIRDELHTAATLDDGVDNIRVKATDRFGAYVEDTLQVFVGTQHGPSDVALDNSEVEMPATAVGTLSTTDADPGDIFTYTLVSGTGDTNNALFEITDDALAFADASEDGTYSIRVRSTDAGGLYTNHIFSISVISTPTDITLSNATVEAGETAVGDLTTTDANPEDTFTYTKVAGTGDTNNALFGITDDALAYLIAPSTTGTHSVRIQTEDANGETFAKAFEITVVDTTAPVMTAFTIPSTGTSYDVTPASGTATDAVGATHFKITESDVAPAHGAAGWVAAASFTSTAYTIVTQNGTGTYTLYCWAKDAANNVSTASISDTIDLTIS